MVICLVFFLALLFKKRKEEKNVSSPDAAAMLQKILGSFAVSINGPEALARQYWSTLLNLNTDQRTALCGDIEKHFEARAAGPALQDAWNTTSGSGVFAVHAFSEVYVAALYAIHKGFATPFVWQSAQTSPLRDRQVVPPEACATCDAAANTLVRICEGTLLRSSDDAQLRFRSLLNTTAMGVPLLSLVLYAYGTAAVDVLARTGEGHKNDASRSRCVESCLDHLRLATNVFTLTSNTAKDQLTIAHPIFLHVARVSGRVQHGLSLFQQPVRSVNPILTGIGLTDYVTYFAEAALLLASVDAHAAAFYALTPVHSLPPLWGLTERSRNRNSSKDNDANARCATMETGHAGRTAAARDTVTRLFPQPSESLAPPPLPLMPQTAAGAASASLYPWFRTHPVSATLTLRLAGVRSECGAGADDEVEWRLILAPKSAEIQRDEQTRAWAIRLSLILLTAAFGGGNPRRVTSTDITSTPSGEREMDWRGMRSIAVPDHLCFPNPTFLHLCQSTRVSLDTLLEAATNYLSANSQTYLELLRAVAQRDVAQAQTILAAASASVFAADLTLPLAQAAVQQYLPRHILLDVARRYTHVPLRFLVERTSQTTAGNDEEHHAHVVLQLLAQLCASGELKSCYVCTKGATETRKSVEEVVAAGDTTQHPVAVEATTVELSMAGAAAYVELCARIVSPLSLSCVTQAKEANSADVTNATLIHVFQQLQSLQKVINADQALLRDLRRE